MQVKANRIAESFKLALMLKLDLPPAPAAWGKSRAPRYRPRGSLPRACRRHPGRRL